MEGDGESEKDGEEEREGMKDEKMVGEKCSKREMK